MDKILAPIKQRILQYIENKSFEKIKFLESIGVSASNFRSSGLKSEIGGEVIAKILSIDESLSADWLLTGSGNMFKSKNLDLVMDETEVYPLKTDKKIKSQIIPLYDIEASAGIVTLFSDSSQITPIDFIQVPGLPKCDGAVKVNGDSMYPLLKSGDIVMYKQVNNIKDGIFWGEMYLISIDHDGDDMVTVKYIKKSEKGDNYIKLVSQNSHHQERDVLLKKVRALALIKASIRINSMS
jgi:phage repressor protein C with HTH and peptisase S24 domain